MYYAWITTGEFTLRKSNDKQFSGDAEFKTLAEAKTYLIDTALNNIEANTETIKQVLEINEGDL